MTLSGVTAIFSKTDVVFAMTLQAVQILYIGLFSDDAES